MMKKAYKKKALHQSIFVMVIVGLCIIPGSANHLIGVYNDSPHAMNRGGSTIYVDDSNTQGPWEGTLEHPYRFIQDGVDNALDGDTVYVFKGTYTENVVVSTSLALIGEDREQTVITGNGFGTVVKIIAQNVTVSGFTVTGSGSNPNNAGIMIHTRQTTITNNNIQNNKYYGITVMQTENTIYHNNIIQNAYQALDTGAGSTWDAGYPTGGNYWSDYTGVDENEDGIGDVPYPTGNSSADEHPLIHPYGSIFNENTKEIFLTIQGAISDSDTLNGHTIRVRNREYWEHVTISKSLILKGEDNKKPIINGRDTGDVVTICANNVVLQGFFIQNSGTAEHNAGVVVYGKNASLMHNVIYRNFHGILLKHSADDTTITSNEIMKNGWNGITLKAGSSRASIFQNTISQNFYAGIGISCASYHHIYHNTFRTNRHQAFDDATNVWDDGYPSGGNYWDDYTGVDADGDGIGDSPYEIPDGINRDRYPLMAPYTTEDTTPPQVTIVSPKNGVYIAGLRLLSGMVRRQTIIFGPITIKAEASDAHSGIDAVHFYVDNAQSPIYVDNQAPYSWTWTRRGTLLRHTFTVIVIAYDKAGNPNYDMMNVIRYL